MRRTEDKSDLRQPVNASRFLTNPRLRLLCFFASRYGRQTAAFSFHKEYRIEQPLPLASDFAPFV